MTRDVRKTVCFAVCIAVLLVALSALAWATSGFKNWNAKEWFNYWGKGAPVVTEPDKPEELEAAPETPDNSEQQTQSVANAGRVMRSLKSGLPGVFYDSDDGVATVTVPDVPVPKLIKGPDALMVRVTASSYTGMKLHVRFYHPDYGDLLPSGSSPVPLAKAEGASSDGRYIVPYSAITNMCYSLLEYDVAPNKLFVTYEFYTINAEGFKSNSVTGDYFAPSNGVAVGCAPEINGTEITLPIFYNGPLTNGAREVASVGYEIGIYPDLKDVRHNNDIIFFNFDIPDNKLAADRSKLVYDSSASVSNGYKIVNTGNAISVDTDNGVYKVDLTQLSFIDELCDACTFIAVPCAYTNTAEKGIHIVDIPIYIEPLYFTIGKLDAPTNIQINTDGALVWEEVAGANGYCVFINDDMKTTETNSLDIRYLTSGEYTVRVRALGNLGQAMSASARLTAFNASRNITQLVLLNYNVDGEVITKLVPYGKAIGDYLYDVEPDDREFGGWFYDNGFSTAVADTDKLEKDTDIYARLSDRQVTERPLTWWEQNMWYVLIPCICLAGIIVLTVIAVAVQKKIKK